MIAAAGGAVSVLSCYLTDQVTIGAEWPM